MSKKSKIQHFTALFILLFGTIACGESESSIKTSISDDVRGHLKDPSSAEFKKLTLTKTSKGTIYVLCGEVNAKNGMGGYVGFSPFTAIRSTDEKEARVDLNPSQTCDEIISFAQSSELITKFKAELNSGKFN